MAVTTSLRVRITSTAETQTKTIDHVNASANNDQLKALATNIKDFVDNSVSVSAAKIVTTDLFAS